MNKNQNKNRLSYFGVGPCYVSTITAFAVLGIHIVKTGYLSGGYFESLKTPMFVFGTIILVSGVFLCAEAVKASKLFQHIRSNELITTGIFAWVRNPLYTGITLIVMGFILRENNIFLLPMIIVYWGIMTFSVKREEETLEKIFGAKYLAYKSSVNRCIPWFPKHK